MARPRFGPRQYAEQTNINPSRFPNPQDAHTDNPERATRRTPGIMPGVRRDYTVPTPWEQSVNQALDEMIDLNDETNATLRSLLQGLVQTVNTIVYEHDTVELPITKETYTLNLPPQTTQLELITGIFCSITNPTLTTGATIDITNAWAELGEAQVNLNAIINSSGGSGGAVPGNFAFLLNADTKRQVNIVSSAEWPVDSYLTFALFGTTVPATLAEVLH